MSAELDAAAAAALLDRGEVVAFPTETVYGLGADAGNATAVRKIFALKGRPADHPLIVHVEEPEHAEAFTQAMGPSARALARALWPGPLTLILPAADGVLREVTGGQDTVGLRCPSHPIAREILARFNAARGAPRGVAAPSANRFGHVSPTNARHVRDEFGDAVPVVDGGDCEVGLESTIIDLSRGKPMLLRPGGIARHRVEEVLGEPLAERDAAAPRASGTLEAHYAPRTTMRLLGPQELSRELASRRGWAVLAFGDPPAGATARCWLNAPRDAAAYAHDLYANLRRLDASGAAGILVEVPPADPEWEAVNDRLRRAAAGFLLQDDEP